MTFAAEVTADILSASDKETLFATSGSLVHPSRGEGFGLIVAEAMAAGLPVITTDSGAVADFTSKSTAWLVPSKLVPCFDIYPCGPTNSTRLHWSTFSKPMSLPPLWLEVKPKELGAIMRHVLDHPQLVESKAALARAYIKEHFSWREVYSIIQRRVAALLT